VALHQELLQFDIDPAKQVRAFARKLWLGDFAAKTEVRIVYCDP
jgi:hypothetical protein